MTAQVRGFLGRMVMDFETAFKTESVTKDGILMPFNTESVRASRQKTTPNTITGTRNPVRPFDDLLDVAGNVTVPVDVLGIGYWMQALFGAAVTTAPTEPDTIYTHVFKPGLVQPSFLLEKRFSTPSGVLKYAKYNGLKVGSFTINAGASGELTAEMSLTGATEALGDTPYDADPAAITPFTRFQQFQATIKENDTAASGVITQCRLEINAGLETDLYTIGDQGTRGDIPEGMLAVTGEITALFNSTSLAWLTKAIDSTASSLELTFANGLNELAFLLPEIEFGRQTPAIEGPQGVRITLPINAFLDTAVEETSVQVTLKNTQTAYA